LNTFDSGSGHLEINRFGGCVRYLLICFLSLAHAPYLNATIWADYISAGGTVIAETAVQAHFGEPLDFESVIRTYEITTLGDVRPGLLEVTVVTDVFYNGNSAWAGLLGSNSSIGCGGIGTCAKKYKFVPVTLGAPFSFQLVAMANYVDYGGGMKDGFAAAYIMIRAFEASEWPNDYGAPVALYRYPIAPPPYPDQDPGSDPGSQVPEPSTMLVGLPALALLAGSLAERPQVRLYLCRFGLSA
jgi:hypothetical protein